MLQQWTARGWESCSVKWLFATHSSNLTRPSFELRVGPVDRQRFLLSLQKLSTLEEFLHSPKALQLHKESSRGRGHRDFVCLSLCCSHHLSQPKPLTQRMPYPEYPTLSAHWGCHKNVEFCLPREMRRHWLSGRSVASSLLCNGESIGPIFRDEIMKYKKNPGLVATALPTATKIIHS